MRYLPPSALAPSTREVSAGRSRRRGAHLEFTCKEAMVEMRVTGMWRVQEYTT